MSSCPICGSKECCGGDMEHEIATLTQQLEEAKAYNETRTAEVMAATQQSAELKQQNAELLKDAARVDFLRINTDINWEWVDRFCFGNGEQLLNAAIASAACSNVASDLEVK